MSASARSCDTSPGRENVAGVAVCGELSFDCKGVGSLSNSGCDSGRTSFISELADESLRSVSGVVVPDWLVEIGLCDPLSLLNEPFGVAFAGRCFWSLLVWR